ncbi:retrovirus-related pol polyprotein from transposon TNT 1-94 [Tanacetum coccineum]
MKNWLLDDGNQMADAGKFRSLVGRLIYLTHTRPDLACAVGLVSRFMHCPSKQHYGAAKRILRDRSPAGNSSLPSCVVNESVGRLESDTRTSRFHLLQQQLLVDKEMVKGLPIIKEREHTCEGCALGKQARKSFPVAQAKRAEEKLELVHADICGPMKTDSYAVVSTSCSSLMTTLVSRMCWVYFLTYKSEAFGFFKKFKALVENQSNRNLIVLKTERGIAERKNRTIFEMARCISQVNNSKLSARIMGRLCYLLLL